MGRRFSFHPFDTDLINHMARKRKTMDEATLKQWQRLHHRVAHGETLSGEEQAFYEAGHRELDQSENIGAATIARIAAMKKTLGERRTELAALSAELLNLEAALDKYSSLTTRTPSSITTSR